jgi:hypothetical protein
MEIDPKRFLVSNLVGELNLPTSAMTTDYTQFRFGRQDFGSIYYAAGVAHLEHMYRLSTDACEMLEFK